MSDEERALEAERLAALNGAGATSSQPPASAPQPDDPDTRTNGQEPASLSQKSVRPVPDEETRTPPELALLPDILGAFVAACHSAGLAGEETLVKLACLALTSRVFPWGKPTERPVSFVPRGATSTGKSFALGTVLRFFPESAYIDLGSMSRKYIFFTEEEFSHRFIYVPEWASIKDDEDIVATVRVLLSEGRVVHGTVDSDGRRKARRIEKDGPTGLLMTTTAATIDAEMETRVLSAITDDSPEQTRRVFVSLAALEEEVDSSVDFTSWQEFQQWIADQGETRVVVDFLPRLAQLMPTSATRLRRDFVSLACLIRAHATLYQAQRERDVHGRIVATVLDDYAPVRDLVAALIAEGVEAGVSEAMRTTVEAVRVLQGEHATPVSPSALTKRLEVGRSATYDRIRRALSRGFLVNEAGREERAMQLLVGAPMPGEQEFLPAPEALLSGSSEDLPDGRFSGSTMRPEKAESASPARPVAPQDELDPDALLEECGDGWPE